MSWYKAGDRVRHGTHGWGSVQAASRGAGESGDLSVLFDSGEIATFADTDLTLGALKKASMLSPRSRASDRSSPPGALSRGGARSTTAATVQEKDPRTWLGWLKEVQSEKGLDLLPDTAEAPAVGSPLVGATAYPSHYGEHAGDGPQGSVGSASALTSIREGRDRARGGEGAAHLGSRPRSLAGRL